MEILALGAPSESVLKFLGTHSVTSISAGERNAAFVTSGGQVFAHGANIAGSCGTGHGRGFGGGAGAGNIRGRDSVKVALGSGFPFEPIVEPRHLQAVAGTRVVKALIGGDMHIAGEKRDSTTDMGMPIAGDVGADKDQAVSATNDFIVLLSASGDVFTAGSNDYGQLGRGVGAPTSDIPVVVPGLAKFRVSHITVGWHHVVAVSHGPPIDTRGLAGADAKSGESGEGVTQYVNARCMSGCPCPLK